MVLEQYFKVGWVETKFHAFYIALIYTLIGIVSARLIFPNDVGKTLKTHPCLACYA